VQKITVQPRGGLPMRVTRRQKTVRDGTIRPQVPVAP
jgi:hypothetical protein